MAISYGAVQTGFKNSFGGAAITVDLSGAPADGTGMVVVLACQNSPASTAPPAPSGWARTVVGTSSTTAVAVYSRVAASETANLGPFDPTHAGTRTWRWVYIPVTPGSFDAADFADVVAASNNSGSTTSHPTGTTATTALADSLAVAAWGFNTDHGGISFSGSYALAGDESRICVAATSVLAVTGTQSCTATTVASRTSDAVIAVFRGVPNQDHVAEDTGTGTDSAVARHDPLATDSGEGTDTASSTATATATDSGTGAETTELTQEGGTNAGVDSATGSDTATLVAEAPPGTDTGTGTDTAALVADAPPGDDTGTGAEAGTRARIGSRTASYGFAGAGTVGGSRIVWTQVTPPGTTVLVEVDAGNGWQPATSGAPIPGVTVGADATGLTVQLRVTLTSTSDTVTPTIGPLEMFVRPLDGAEMVPLGVYTIETVTSDERPGGAVLVVTGRDRSGRVAEAPWQETMPISDDPLVTDTIIGIVVPALTPTAVPIELPILPDTVARMTLGADQTTRWVTAARVAGPTGHDVAFNGRGALTMRRTPNPATDPPTLRLVDGENNVRVLPASSSTDRSKVYNGVRCRGEAPWLLYPVAGEVWVTDPTSLIHPDRIGKRPYEITSSTAGSDEACQAEAQAKFSEVVGAEEAITVTCTPDPTIEAGDIALVKAPHIGVNGRFVVQSIDIASSGAMTLQMIGRRR